MLSAPRCGTIHAFNHFKLAELLRGKLGAEEFAEQQRLLGVDVTDAQHLLLHFGLASVRDAQGDYAAAAGHLAQANALQHDFIKHSPKPCPPRYLRNAHRAVDRGLPRAPETFHRVGFGLESELPVFVVGLPPSGTTLVGGSSWPAIRKSSAPARSGWPATRWPGSAAMVPNRSGGCTGWTATPPAAPPSSTSKTPRHAPAADRIVNKMPENYLHLGMLAALVAAGDASSTAAATSATWPSRAG